MTNNITVFTHLYCIHMPRYAYYAMLVFANGEYMEACVQCTDPRAHLVGLISTLSIAPELTPQFSRIFW